MIAQGSTDPTRRVTDSILQAAPLFPVAVGMVVGIVVDEAVAPPPSVYIGLFIAVCAVALRRAVRHRIGVHAVLLASMSLGGLLHLSAVRAVPATSIERHTQPAKRLARIRGTVTSVPRFQRKPETPFSRWSFGADRTTFLLDTESVEGDHGWLGVSGRIRVTASEPIFDLHQGEQVELFGWLYCFNPPRNPGGYDWAARYRRQGVVAGFLCKRLENVRRLDSQSVAPSRGLLHRLRTAARGMLTDDLTTGSSEEASLLEAMILGHRSGLDRHLNEIFIRAGCAHFLAVSGLHLGIPIAFVWWIVRRLGGSKWQAALFALATIALYVCVAIPRPPILRAAVMGSLFCLAVLLRRPHAGLNWVSAAAIILLCVQPAGLFAPGFQLSFTAVFGVIYLSRSLRGVWDVVHQRAHSLVAGNPYATEDGQLSDYASRSSRGWPRRHWLAHRYVRRVSASAFWMAVGAWLATLPIVMLYFNRIHFWSPVSSFILFLPVCLLVTLGFVKLAVELLLPGFGAYLTVSMSFVDGFLVRLAEALAELPGATVHIGAPPAQWTIAWYIFLVLSILCVRHRRASTEALGGDEEGRGPASPWLNGAWAASFLALVVCTASWVSSSFIHGRLVVTVLSVGAGSAAVIDLPDGRTLLFDAGSSSPYDVGRGVVVPFLSRRGTSRIDRVYVSHANLDHFSALPSILEEFPTGPVMVNGHFRKRATARSPARALLRILADRGHEVRTIDPSRSSWEFGGVRFDYVWPPASAPEAMTTNDTSTVLRLSYGGRSVLLTGDIEEQALRALLQRGGLSADVLVLPHHGGVVRSTPAFLRAVAPVAVIRSSSQPMARTNNGLRRIVGDVPLYNTADGGAIEIVIDPDRGEEHRLEITSFVPE